MDIIVKKGMQEERISCLQGESILEMLLRNNMTVSAVCGGNGTCGKCKIRVLEGELPATVADRSFFSKEEWTRGYRLGCKAFPNEPCKIQIFDDREEEFAVLSHFQNEKQENIKRGRRQGEGILYKIGIDIGTTTLAGQIEEIGQEGAIAVCTAVNHQRKYGADVISRIQASNGGKREELKESIRKDLRGLINDLIQEIGCKREQVREIALAGNTVMIHLFMGYSCETLGSHPFCPVNTNWIYEVLDEIPVTILPSLSAFIGGDILSGLYACGWAEREETGLFLDLGTNGEMAIGTRREILCTSAAAGPAFEGGNITWGMGSVPGAICGVNIEGEKVSYETIMGKRPPIGICGTGVTEITAELLKAKIIDKGGLLSDCYFDKGYPIGETEEGKNITFTQKDIREFQMAKAAIRAGIETLIKRYGTSYEKIQKVYLAGGFGYCMNKDKAAYVGLLPIELLNKISSVGNSSLKGAILCGGNEEGKRKIEWIKGMSKEMNLAKEKGFQDLYLEHMYF